MSGDTEPNNQVTKNEIEEIVKKIDFTVNFLYKRHYMFSQLMRLKPHAPPKFILVDAVTPLRVLHMVKRRG